MSVCTAQSCHRGHNLRSDALRPAVVAAEVVLSFQLTSAPCINHSRGRVFRPFRYNRGPSSLPPPRSDSYRTASRVSPPILPLKDQPAEGQVPLKVPKWIGGHRHGCAEEILEATALQDCLSGTGTNCTKKGRLVSVPGSPGCVLAQIHPFLVLPH